MKAIVSRRALSLSLNSSAIRNTCTYLSRSRRLVKATEAGDGRTWFLDKTVDWTRPWSYDTDQLQYTLLYCNSHCSPEDLLSAARGRLVTAENLEEEARDLQNTAEEDRTRARVLRRRARILEEQAHLYGPIYARLAGQFYEEARDLEAFAEDLEASASCNCDNAADCRRTAEYFEYEAEEVLKEELLISRWEELYDMI